MMLKNIYLIALFAIISLGLFSQTITLSFSFTAENNGTYVELSRVKAMNLTHGGETTITGISTAMTLEITPGDTILFIGYAMGFPVGVQGADKRNASFTLSQNYPNPVKDQSLVSLLLPESGMLTITVADLHGRNVIFHEQQFEKGTHSFRFSPAKSSLYFLTARWNGISRSIKILHTGSESGEVCRLDYLGSGNGEIPLKTTLLESDLVELESGILDTPAEDKTYTFQFAYNIPCPGMPTVTYGGQVYHTVQIFSQCWLKENLNVGTMLEICTDQTDNGYMEKFCYYDNPDSCSKYGGLYQWDEMMQYTNQQGVQGICPPKWHLPTDEEWKLLMGAADTEYGIGDSIWNNLGSNGFDAGTNLKSTYGWHQHSNGWMNGCGTDLFGFTGLPGGFRDFYGCGNYGYVTQIGYWWTSTEINENIKRVNDLLYNSETVTRYTHQKRTSYSVRCLKNL